LASFKHDTVLFYLYFAQQTRFRPLNVTERDIEQPDEANGVTKTATTTTQLIRFRTAPSRPPVRTYMYMHETIQSIKTAERLACRAALLLLA
jgi:hypothetical protein